MVPETGVLAMELVGLAPFNSELANISKNVSSKNHLASSYCDTAYRNHSGRSIPQRSKNHQTIRTTIRSRPYNIQQPQTDPSQPPPNLTTSKTQNDNNNNNPRPPRNIHPPPPHPRPNLQIPLLPPPTPHHPPQQPHPPPTLPPLNPHPNPPTPLLHKPQTIRSNRKNARPGQRLPPQIILTFLSARSNNTLHLRPRNGSHAPRMGTRPARPRRMCPALL